MPWPNSPPLLSSPALEPDELFSSWLARCAASNVLDSEHAVLRSVYGLSGRFLPRLNEFALKLGALCGYLGPWSPGLDSDDWILRATVYPYFRPFISCATDARARAIMASGSGSGLKTLLGLVANRFGASTRPRLCPLCAKEDLQRIGFPYLRRSHHLAAVTRCAIHGSRLQELPASSEASNLFAWLCRNPEAAPKKRSRNAFDQSQSMDSLSARQEHWFARISLALLTAGLAPQDPSARGRAYGAAARLQGHGIRNGRVDHRSLAQGIRAYYREFSFLSCKERLLQPSSNPSAWVRSLIARPDRTAHPICHILAIGYLFDSVESFAQAVQDQSRASSSIHVVASQEAERPTSPIASPGASRLTSTLPAPRQREVDAPSQHGVLLDASVSCREAARLLAVSIDKVACARLAAGIPVAQRPQKINSTLAASLLDRMAQGLSLPEIAEFNQVSLSSLYRLLESHPQAAATRAHATFESDLHMHRDAWEDAVRRSAGRGSKLARALAPAAYAWLYRHDPTFVRSHRPAPRPSRSPVVDWNLRDSMLVRRLALLAQSAPEVSLDRRRTATFWMNCLGSGAPHPARRERFPQTMNLVRELAESDFNFRLRRARGAVAELSRRGQPLEYWRVHRAASLRDLPKAAYLKALSQVANRGHSARS
ncbi:TniQ family protein [Rhizobacter sp. AJA081-3]|uniref:TnsD family Tn7-like transposition protein n=1 Tax=Rhizobacter sp. AJA081-3 TaxID=2753607 RepID=UPI001ADEF774|nr:TnsD family Tn7-like transposition protein [Rhizobacter sp. AJA081-3]QTN22214.1 TniQ family protein [Rhizobacter sp. AJA081-3]